MKLLPVKPSQACHHKIAVVPLLDGNVLLQIPASEESDGAVTEGKERVLAPAAEKRRVRIRQMVGGSIDSPPCQAFII